MKQKDLAEKLKPEIYTRARRYFEDQKSVTFRNLKGSMERATREVLRENNAGRKA